MEVTLTCGAELDELAVGNLFTAYFYELAAWDPGIVLNDAGLPVWAAFGLPGPRTLDECSRHNWWIRDACRRYAIRRDGAAVGFAVVLDGGSHLPPGADFEIVDLYVAPKARSTGAGRAAAGELLRRHRGEGVLFTLAANAGAQGFWRAVLAGAARDVRENGDATEFRFRS